MRARTHILSLPLSDTHILSLSLSLSLSHTHTISLSLAHTHTFSLSHTHTFSLSLSHTHVLSLSLCLSLCLSLSLSHTHTHSLSLTHTHAHTKYVWRLGNILSNLEHLLLFLVVWLICCLLMIVEVGGLVSGLNASVRKSWRVHVLWRWTSRDWKWCLRWAFVKIRKGVQEKGVPKILCPSSACVKVMIVWLQSFFK